MSVKICRYCGYPFEPNNRVQIYCNDKCRVSFYKDGMVRKCGLKKKHKFPKFSCDCGNVMQLNFFPKEKDVWGIICSKCKKHYD